MRLLLEIFRTALGTLRQNKMRSALTMLGVTIGVGSVITMVSLGMGARVQVKEQIEGLGTNMLFVFSGTTTSGGARTGTGSAFTLTVDDAHAIARECPDVAMTSYGKRETNQVIFGNQNWNTVVSGVTPEYQLIRNWPMKEGTFFDERDMERAATVCVLGSKVAENLFVRGEDPLGETIIIKNVPFRVIGIMSPRGAIAGGGGGDQDDQIFIPYTTAEWKIIGSVLPGYVGIIYASAVNSESIGDAEEQIKTLLRQRHNIQHDQPDDFVICTGEAHSVREFLEEAFAVVGLNPDNYVKFDPRFARPGNTSALLGDTSKARQKFGFNPQVKFKQLVRIMVEHDLKLAEEELRMKRAEL